MILSNQSNTVILKANLEIQGALDSHSFHYINVWPRGNSFAINPKKQAVWLRKRNFNSWIGARPRAEHRQMDTQGCWAAWQHIQQTLLLTLLLTPWQANLFKLFYKVSWTSSFLICSSVPSGTYEILSMRLSDAIGLPTQVQSQSILSRCSLIVGANANL